MTKKINFMPVIHVQTCGILTILTSKSARVNDLSPHVIFAII